MNLEKENWAAFCKETFRCFEHLFQLRYGVILLLEMT
jgi:hypothetical protein